MAAFHHNPSPGRRPGSDAGTGDAPFSEPSFFPVTGTLLDPLKASQAALMDQWADTSNARRYATPIARAIGVAWP